MAFDRSYAGKFALGKLPVRLPRCHRIIGRFRTGRHMAACALAAYQGVETFFTRPGVHSEKSLFDASIGACASALRAHGYFPGLLLPDSLVAELISHARETPCVGRGPDHERFLISALRNGLTPRGHLAPVADVDLTNPHPVIDAIADDELLTAIAAHQLGYRPRKVRKRLFWSPVSALSDDNRRCNGQTIDFHYDIDACNSLYVYFYLTDTDRNSGAHTLLAGSHGRKPLRIVFSSCFQPEEVVLTRYGADSQVVIEGPAGFGFIEDPACFHKALVPRTAERLALQLRYS